MAKKAFPGGARRGAVSSARGVRVVWTTVPPRAARRIARVLVASRLAACVTAVPGARSVFRWRGKVEEAQETLLIAKTTARAAPALVAALVREHPYDVPEVILFTPGSGLASYLAWISGSVGSERA